MVTHSLTNFDNADKFFGINQLVAMMVMSTYNKRIQPNSLQPQCKHAWLELHIFLIFIMLWVQFSCYYFVLTIN